MKPYAKLSVETLEDRVAPSGIDTMETTQWKFTFDKIADETTQTSAEAGGYHDYYHIVLFQAK
jgi:hypothetical protein